MNIPNLLATKCPKCGKREVNAVKEEFTTALLRNIYNLMFPIRLLFSQYRKPKPLYVCRACGFDWEKR